MSEKPGHPPEDMKGAIEQLEAMMLLMMLAPHIPEEMVKPKPKKMKVELVELPCLCKRCIYERKLDRLRANCRNN